MRGGWVCAILCLPAAVGCTYDWAYSDAGAPDATSEASVPVDAPSDAHSDAGSSGADATSLDGASDSPAAVDAPDCAALETQMLQDRALAVKCASGTTACTTYVTDECGCWVVVGDQNSVDTADYSAAVSQFKTSCSSFLPVLCQQSCGPKPQPDLCIVSDGGNYACYQ